MDVQVNLVGTSPLLMHNPRMVDPDFDLCRQIKALTSKRKKTDDDLRQIERLEWYGGLFTEHIDGELTIVQPTAKVRKCLINTAKIFKLGKAVERALSFRQLNVPLHYDGPRDIDELWEDPRFRSRLSVVIGGKRILRVRPMFFPWQLSLTGLFIDDAGLNFDELARIVEMAGVVERLGDNRINGYGAFIGEILANGKENRR